MCFISVIRNFFWKLDSERLLCCMCFSEKSIWLSPIRSCSRDSWKKAENDSTIARFSPNWAPRELNNSSPELTCKLWSIYSWLSSPNTRFFSLKKSHTQGFDMRNALFWHFRNFAKYCSMKTWLFVKQFYCGVIVLYIVGACRIMQKLWKNSCGTIKLSGS